MRKIRFTVEHQKLPDMEGWRAAFSTDLPPYLDDKRGETQLYRSPEQALEAARLMAITVTREHRKVVATGYDTDIREINAVLAALGSDEEPPF